MRTRTALETAIICVAVVVAIAVVAPVDNGKWVVAVAWAGVAGLAIALPYQYLTTRKRAQVELTGGEQYRQLAEEYRQLAEEYRRLSDLASTAQEHTDLKLGEVTAQLDHLQEQIASLQKILKDVE